MGDIDNLKTDTKEAKSIKDMALEKSALYDIDSKEVG